MNDNDIKAKSSNDNQDILLLIDQFRIAIESCRTTLGKIDVKEEKTFYYAIIRTYSRMIVTCYC